ncbi:hypothetical protein [Anaeromicropila populeti]|uniref:Uncharacterized protein n=1 Tax=Anaeromicropila populeti TaxID=37658 RepID=A0A1I6IRY9_9FIRM|nr:hypothetical protein [Anaeromicropila populeti]SFR69488.1 hypothetical protein SAMN05661086_01104 [Anaeromicropila populeti]
MFQDIDFGKGVNRKYIDFNINEVIPLKEQTDLLKEDLIQVIYESNYLIDIGWYPEFDEEGFFRVSIIKDYQWENPVLQKNCRDLNLLKEYVDECIDIIQTKVK